mmetsp:Transcript_31901/g.54950  ORF Transcript_31901/g.54950 Transcript_31901/m.54950 type:complete len:370 (+) Transcript_31901:45-1154(+)
MAEPGRLPTTKEIVHLFKDGMDVESICRATTLEYEQVLAALLGVSLSNAQLTVLKDLRNYEMASKSDSCDASDPLTSKQENLKHLGVSSKSWKLSQLLGVEASKVQALLKQDMSRQPKGRSFDYNTRTYSYMHSTNFLSATNLATGARSSFSISRVFRVSCSWVELPDQSLFFTGGVGGENEVWIIDIIRQYAVIDKPPMIHWRSQHSTVYIKEEVYAISGEYVKQCERFRLAGEKWDSLPDIPVPVYCHTAISSESTNSIFVFGGEGRKIIQELSLLSMTWQILPVRLSHADYHIPVFKTNSDEGSLYFTSERVLYKFILSSKTIERIKPISRNIESWYGPSYYVSGRLYCPSGASTGYALDLQGLTE